MPDLIKRVLESEINFPIQDCLNFKSFYFRSDGVLATSWVDDAPKICKKSSQVKVIDGEWIQQGLTRTFIYPDIKCLHVIYFIRIFSGYYPHVQFIFAEKLDYPDTFESGYQPRIQQKTRPFATRCNETVPKSISQNLQFYPKL